MGNMVLDADTAISRAFTPSWLVARMVALAQPSGRCRVLEPGCAHAPFLTEFAARYGDHHELVGVDIEDTYFYQSKLNLPSAQFVQADFLLWEPNVRFDIIIGSPPYGRNGSHYTIQQYKQHSHTWHGKYNIYGLFLEKALKLLEPSGKLVFVIPATWMVLDDFKLLRQYLSRYRVEVWYLGRSLPSSKVSVCILRVRSGRGLTLYDDQGAVIDLPNWVGEMVRFLTDDWYRFEHSGVPVGSLFDIQFAARSTHIRSHPLTIETPSKGRVPVLTGRNLHAGWIDYENCYSGLWFPLCSVGELKSIYKQPHLVVAHKKGTRVVCAVDRKCYPWSDEFHLVQKRDIDLDEVVHYLNGPEIRRYMSSVYRDIVPYLTKEMLKRVPVNLSSVASTLPIDY